MPFFEWLKNKSKHLTLIEQNFLFHKIFIWWGYCQLLILSLSGPQFHLWQICIQSLWHRFTLTCQFETLHFYFYCHHLLKLNEFPFLLASLLTWVTWIHWTLDSCWIYIKKVLQFSVYKKFGVINSELFYGGDNFHLIGCMGHFDLLHICI